MPLNLQI